VWHGIAVEDHHHLKHLGCGLLFKTLTQSQSILTSSVALLCAFCKCWCLFHTSVVADFTALEVPHSVISGGGGAQADYFSFSVT
jgi:hypothetical protein